jgi:hypothetical protein
MTPHFFVTVDAETDVIQNGIRVISGIRDEIEARENLRIPLVWFVRFQRGWSEYVECDSAEALQKAFTKGFDGFALAREELLDLQARGDEIGWHYHAYNYAHRDDLSHATRLKTLEADLRSCARELRRRHPDFAVKSFRFGWFFVPDYSIYDTLKAVGITRDASIRPDRDGQRVGEFPVRFLRPLVAEPTAMDGLTLFPFSHTICLHDWSLVGHDFGWSRLSESEAVSKRDEFKTQLAATAARLRRGNGEFSTYETFPAGSIARFHNV